MKRDPYDKGVDLVSRPMARIVHSHDEVKPMLANHNRYVPSVSKNSPAAN